MDDVGLGIMDDEMMRKQGWKVHGTSRPLPTPYGCQTIPCRGVTA